MSAIEGTFTARQSATEIRDAVREQVQAQREVIRAQAEAQREAIKAQIEAQRAMREAGQTSNIVGQIPPLPPLPPIGGSDIPTGAVILGVVFFGAAAITIIFGPLMRAWARRIDRRSVVANTADHPDTTARLERIEQAVEAISIEVERISEGQRFTNQVMNDMRSLPAGGAPAEAIRVREREGLAR